MDSHRVEQKKTSLLHVMTEVVPNMSMHQLRDVIYKFNLVNILFCYCIPFFYVFYPTLLMPAILLRSISLVIGWLYGAIAASHSAGGMSRPKKASARSSQPTTSAVMPDSDSDGDMNNMYFWLQRCSICLDEIYSLCLETCRDQFCKQCFARYVEETVHASWGLGVTRVRCPVCREFIPQSEWSKYVSPDVVEKYNRYNRPYRPFSRHCNQCQEQVTPCPSPRQGESRESRLQHIGTGMTSLADVLGRLGDVRLMIRLQEAQTMFHQACDKRSALRTGRVQDLYRVIGPLLGEIGQQRGSLYQTASSLSQQMVGLEIIPETWRQLQFWHIAHFPYEPCTHCPNVLCMRCGETHHGSRSCTDHLRVMLVDATATDPHSASTLQWKLDNTRSCPSCSVMINRDEGCNKVDCLLCGHLFCWSCGRSWSQQRCGFYQCGMTKSGGNDSESVMVAYRHGIKTELGVPDMDAIDARRQTHRQDH